MSHRLVFNNTKMTGTVSVLQLKALVDFMEEHPELALGRCTRSKEGRTVAKHLWKNCASILNTVSSDCMQKGPDQWRLYFNEYKSKLLRKIKAEMNETSAEGGAQAKFITLTPLQKRLYSVLGRDVGESLQGVCHDPISQFVNGGEGGSGHKACNNKNSTFLSNDSLEVEIVDDEGQQNGNQRSQMQLQGKVERLREAETESVEQPPAREQKRNRKRTRKQSQESNEDNNEQELTMPDVIETLASIERINADAMLVQAAAINRLAAAIEAIAERLPIPVSTPAPAASAKRRYRASMTDSNPDDTGSS